MSDGWVAYAAVLAFMIFVFGAIPFVDAMIVLYVDDRYRSRVAGIRLAGRFGMLLIVMAALSTFTALCLTLLPGRIPRATPAPVLAVAVAPPL